MYIYHIRWQRIHFIIFPSTLTHAGREPEKKVFHDCGRWAVCCRRLGFYSEIGLHAGQEVKDDGGDFGVSAKINMRYNYPTYPSFHKMLSQFRRRHGESAKIRRHAFANRIASSRMDARVRPYRKKKKVCLRDDCVRVCVSMTTTTTRV